MGALQAETQLLRLPSTPLSAKIRSCSTVGSASAGGLRTTGFGPKHRRFCFGTKVWSPALAAPVFFFLSKAPVAGWSAMKCPQCGDDGQQRRVGPLHDRELVIYHCQACEHLYAVHSCDDDDDEEE
jgi:hypothetical protein